jgi:hypothetical protein
MVADSARWLRLHEPLAARRRKRTFHMPRKKERLPDPSALLDHPQSRRPSRVPVRVFDRQLLKQADPPAFSQAFART